MSLISILCATSLASAAGGAAAPEPLAVRTRYLMGTLCTGSVLALSPAAASGGAVPPGQSAGRALEAAFEEIARLEAILSDWRPESELSRLGRSQPAAPVACSADLFDFLALCSDLSARTGGAFDITVGPLVSAWDLRGAGREPSEAELSSALARVGANKLHLDRPTRSASLAVASMSLDPGAIGKGYALDAALRLLASHGVSAGWLDFGGQVAVLGLPPGRAGWPIDISHPLDRERAALAIELPSGSVSTSSNVGRAGRAGHILDPRTGRPVEWRGSVTVVAPTASLADAWSTALFVLGPDHGPALLEKEPGISALYLSPGKEGSFAALASPGFPTTHPAAGDLPAASHEGSRP